MTQSKSVHYQEQEGIAILTMSQPQTLNALNQDMITGLQESLDHIAKTPDIRVLLLKGSGGNFMAGGDITMFAHKLTQQNPDFTAEMDAVHHMVRSLKSLDIPVIAQIDGAAAGFGVSLALACDLIIASETSFFSLAYSLLGISPDGGSTWALPRHIGLKKAMEMALTGDRYPADKLLEMGLVNHVIPADQVEAYTLSFALKLCKGPKQAYAQTKKLLNASLDRDIHAQLDAEAEAFLAGTKTPDFTEGVTAFIEKRPAKFT